MKKGNLIITIIVTMMLAGCSANSMASIYNDNDKIASNSNSFNLDLNEQFIDGDKFSGSVKKFEGMDTIWSYEANEDMTIDMDYLLNVKSGKVKLVLINPDNSVTDLIERSSEASIDDYATNSLGLKKGLNRIKMVGGKDTSVDFEITILKGEFNELGL